MPTSLIQTVLVAAAIAPQGGAPVRIERQLGAMGTTLRVVVVADERGRALELSERAVRAIEATEARLSTWREDSELARLNRVRVGEPFTLSPELAHELELAQGWWRSTGGAFDPAVGGLVRAWALRTGGRRPSASELAAARVPGGFGALDLEGGCATRSAENLVLEEGGFGKGAGLDAAAAALAGSGAAGWLDLGGQLLVFGGPAEPFDFSVADPRERGREVLRVRVASGSLATSGNSERGIVVDGERLGHLLDPRSGLPAADFGSLTVRAPNGLAADALATGLFVLGPDAALAYAREHAEIAVLVLELLDDGSLRLRSAGDWEAEPELLDPHVRVAAREVGAPDDLPTPPSQEPGP